MSKESVICRHTIKMDGRYHFPGELISVDEDEARRLSDKGAVQRKRDTGQRYAVSKPDGRALVGAISARIGELDPDNPEAWTKDGRPAAGPLGELLGYAITADERDEGWSAHKTGK